MVNFVPVDAYHFCLALPVAFTQPGVRHLAQPCIVHGASVPLKRLCHFNFRRPFEEGRREEAMRWRNLEEDVAGIHARIFPLKYEL